MSKVGAADRARREPQGIFTGRVLRDGLSQASPPTEVLPYEVPLSDSVHRWYQMCEASSRFRGPAVAIVIRALDVR